MNELTITIGALMFIFGWYGLSKLVGWLARRWEHSRIVWCAPMKTFSIVDVSTRKGGANGEVRRCLLWPEQHDCAQRCIHARPLPPPHKAAS
jgi:hypothetical protein